MPMPRRPAIAWALYDWADSAFATTVMAGFFPVFFKQYWAADLTVTESSFWLGLANGFAGLLVVILAPLLGTLADCMGGHKRWLTLFALLGVLSTALLPLAAQGHWPLAAMLYMVAVVGFSGSNVFYDSLLPKVAGGESLERVSSLGYSLGYLGGGLLFAVQVLMVSKPGLFGLVDTASAVKVAFVTTALWWFVFSIPLVLWVREEGGRAIRWGQDLRLAVDRLGRTLRHVRALPETFLFLVAYWFYIDGVDTIIRMAVDFGLALGFGSGDLMKALLITQFVGFPAALVFGYLGERWGAKQGIGLAIIAYLLIAIWGSRIQAVGEFYLLAVSVGMVQGGIQALSRSLFARLIPPGCEGEFFGFYNMLGKFAVVLGPVLMGLVAHLSGDTRLSILSVTLLFLIGGALLLRVDVARGEVQARGFRVHNGD
ncbi:MAG: MFS transporter [Gammaproteobacteria bacterium]|nr:MFS transporter [Gammaproteobacteria bacterium]MBU1654398.1 MFS transporter [Gammaproteobacteria bacterium]MBU1960239.1 MFS transporter [Gammaproteobacteria bacterium]